MRFHFLKASESGKNVALAIWPHLDAGPSKSNMEPCVALATFRTSGAL
jgi:hypothetical protein